MRHEPDQIRLPSVERVDGPHGYQLFKDKQDGNLRTVFLP